MTTRQRWKQPEGHHQATDTGLQETLPTTVAAPSHRSNITYTSPDHLLRLSTSPPCREAPSPPALAQMSPHNPLTPVLLPPHEPFFNRLQASQRLLSWVHGAPKGSKSLPSRLQVKHLWHLPPLADFSRPERVQSACSLRQMPAGPILAPCSPREAAPAQGEAHLPNLKQELLQAHQKDPEA